ncbi:MAG: DUF1186 domain-containing protein [Gemmobacter sp.]
MTPAQIMSALSRRDALPRAAMQAAGRSRTEMVPVLLDLIARLNARRPGDPPPTQADVTAILCVFYLLAEWRETAAYRPLATLLRLPPDVLDSLLGDVVTEGAARVIASVFDGDLGPLFDVLLDTQADDFARGAMLETLVMVVLDGRAPRPEAEAFLVEFPDRISPDTDEWVWWAWCECVAALGLEALLPQVTGLFQSGRISPMLGTLSDIEDDLRATLAEGRPARFVDSPHHLPVTDAVAEVSVWCGFSAASRSGRSRRTWSFSDGSASAPVTLPPKVGRNDPCPCGSGKKHKKCCLA